MRVLAGLVGVVALAALAALGGGGWYFAGVIESDALAVRHSDPVADLVLTPAAEGRVMVRSENRAELDPLAAGFTYGLSWEGGYGQVSGPAKVEDGGVLRDLAVLQGAAPTAGTAASLDRDSFPDDPAVALGVPVEDVPISAVGISAAGRDVRIGEDGAAFPAWFVPGRGSTWAVLVHGKGGSRAEMLRMMRTTVAAGMPSLDITYRNDVGAPADDSGRYRYGATEWRDLAAAVSHAQESGAERVVLVGASMGGAIVASYLREVPDAPVAAVVLDSPMLDLGTTISFGASRRSFPVVGSVPAPLTWVAKRITTLRYGVDWQALDYLDTSDWLTVPALVVHGEADTTVPIVLSRRLAAQHPDLVDLVVSPEAGHVESWNVDPDGYDALLRSFLDVL